jgi:hypothetical protein
MMIGGALMGFSPQQVKAMTIQEFSIIAAGYSEAHGGKKRAETLSESELEQLGIEGI